MKTLHSPNSVVLAFLMSAALLGTGGCDKPLTQVEPGGDDDRIIVITTNRLIQSQNGVVVDGQTVFRKRFRPDSSIFVHDESNYRYHTQFGDIETEWIHSFISFNAELNMAPRKDPADPGFTFVVDDLDLGQLTLNETEINTVTTGDVDFGDTPDSLLDIINLKAYWYHIYQSSTNSLGNTFIELDTPLHGLYQSGTELTLAGTGASEIEDFSAGLNIERAPSLTGVTNGSALNFTDDIPRITAGNDLLLTFDRPLRAGVSFLTFIPLPSEGNTVNYSDVKEKAAFVSIIEDTDEVIITSDVLQQLKANSDVTSEAYSLSIYTFAQGGDVTFTTVPGSDVDSYTFPVFTEGIIDMFVIFLP